MDVSWLICHLLFFFRMLPYQRNAPSMKPISSDPGRSAPVYSELGAQAVTPGHIPIGELEAEERGESSGKLIPQWGHALCSLKSNSPSPVSSTRRLPSPTLSAVSTESIRRVAKSGMGSFGITRRSTTTSIVCLVFSSLMLASSSTSTINTCPDVAIAAQLRREVAMGTFPILHHRRKDLQSGTRLEPRQSGRRCAVRSAVQPCGRRRGSASPRYVHKKYAQVIHGFGHCADGRSRVTAHGFLLDCYRRAQASDVVNLWLLGLTQELSDER